MRNPPTAIVNALAAAPQRGIIERDFVAFTVRDSEGAPVTFGFWAGREAIALDVPNAAGGTDIARSYTGDGALIAIGAIKLTSTLTVQRTNVTLSATAPRVLDMLNGHDMRLAPAEIHRALYDPATRELVAAPELHFAGEVNAAPRETAAAGGESTITVTLVSDTRQLTRSNPAKRSDAFLAARSGDRFYRYVNAVANRDIYWGKRNEPQAPFTPSCRSAPPAWLALAAGTNR
ncbi:MAG: hypothetical protein R3D34_06890 [Nitratireductor sp.]